MHNKCTMVNTGETWCTQVCCNVLPAFSSVLSCSILYSNVLQSTLVCTRVFWCMFVHF